MRDQTNPKYFLHPGDTHASATECLITTVLGSCVAVCLWDSVTHIGGMNHFMLPHWSNEYNATPKYGSIAMDQLLTKIIALGCHPKHLIAKVFGGAQISDTGKEYFMIGDQNINFALQLLEQWNIPVIASDLGGTCGRKVIMNTATGEILLGRNYRLSP